MIQKIKKSFLNNFSFFMALPALVWQLGLCIIPLLFVVFSSFIDTYTWHFTTKYYKALFDMPHVYIVSWSLLLALLTSIGCILIGYPVAYWLAVRIKYFKNFFLFLLIVPFWTNLLVLVYSWIFILERNGFLNNVLMSMKLINKPLPLLNSLFAVLLVTIYCYLPFMILPIFSSLEKIDNSILEASADLGATATQRFFSIILPMTWSGIRTGLLLVFVPVFGEYAIPLLMGGDKYMFVGNAISHYVFIAHDLSTGAALTIIAGIALFMSMLLVSWLAKRFVFKF
jgi:spermidine/putrescine transport system permease protein